MALLINWLLFAITLHYIKSTSEVDVNAFNTGKLYPYEDTQNLPILELKAASTAQNLTSSQYKIHAVNNGEIEKTFGMTLRNKSVKRNLDPTNAQASNLLVDAHPAGNFYRPSWVPVVDAFDDPPGFGQYNIQQSHKTAKFGGPPFEARAHFPPIPQDSFEFASWENKFNNLGLLGQSQGEQRFRGWGLDPDTARLQAYTNCLKWKGLPSQQFVSRDLDSIQYNLLNRQWNLRKDTVYPRGYLLPTSAQHVAAAVICGLQSGVRLVANSGGHSHESISWGTNETIIVDFRTMNNISVDGSGPGAVGRIQPGALVGQINAYLWENGGYATPLGNCMTIGIGGHAFGGGVGYYSGQYGLAVDNVLEFEMVDGKGRIVVANQNQNPDLYWALRGGGPGYIGIVTNLKVKLFMADQIKFTVVRLRYDLKDFATSYIGFQNMLQWKQNNEPGIFIVIMIASDTYNGTLPQLAPGVLYTLVHIQDPNVQPKGNEAFLAAISANFPQAAQMFMYTPNYIQMVILTGYAPVLLPGPNGQLMTVGRLDNPALYPNSSNVAAMMPPSVSDEVDLLKRVAHKEISAPRYFKAKTMFIRSLFTLAEMEKLGELISRMPQDNFWILANSETNALQIRDPSATAYVHRDALIDLTLQYEGSSDPDTVKEGIEYLYELWDAIQFMDGGETYQNFPDLDVKDHLIRNYGQNLQALIRQKQKWDPHNYFVNQISLPGSKRFW